jgi:2-keto-4-pentenoate hydratase/2-oxohepta-3-ene-1,7-dioic acid hydratase in catechol pathway
MQQGSTATMIFGVAHIVAYLSRFVLLEPGDLILTGTPPGVGMGKTPPVYLSDGDRVSLSIAGLGRQYTPVRAD